jgi:very-short-patch-repair endonuclease
MQPTQAEATLWAYLRNNRLLGLPFRRQHVVCGFIADFFCHRIKLAIEVDGSIHEQQQDYDRERDAILLLHGIKTLRFTNEDVLSNPLCVSRQIETAIALL